ncbi:unnamed protein product [Adineta ricciae]|uniref:Uncharacterized protein n=1 Tax=Adineta ricciae TaxID=249248 RepID=A0A815YQW0_ADIRI|nr:unnamed protein product [Adineta ricciae]
MTTETTSTSVTTSISSSSTYTSASTSTSFTTSASTTATITTTGSSFLAFLATTPTVTSTRITTTTTPPACTGTAALLSIMSGSISFFGLKRNVTNGDFESNSYTPNWTKSGSFCSSGDFTIDSSPVHSGNYSFHNGCSNSLTYLGQPFTAAIGTTYNVTFWLKNGSGSNDNTDVHVG